MTSPSFFISVLLLLSFTLFFFFFSASFTSAAFVKLDTSKPVCFVEETTYSKEQIFLQYARRDYTRTQNQFVHLEVSDSVDGIGKPFFKKELKAHSGMVVIQTVAARIGQYTICISSPFRDVMNSLIKAPGYEDVLELEILIDHEGRRLPIGSAKEHHAAIRTKVKREGQREDDEVFEFTDETGHTVSSLRSHSYLDRLEKVLDKVESQVESVSSDSLYFVRKQAEMRSTSESTFSRIWAFSVAVISVLVGMTAIQLYSLRSFFKQRKLS